MKQNKPVIGITGAIASGKSTASRYFRDHYQIPMIDADIVGHEVLEDPKVIEQLIRAFGTQILTEEKVDRKKLGGIVFSDPEKLAVLNGISHPAITARIREWIDLWSEKTEAPVLMIEAYGLLQSELKELVTEVWVVDCPAELRIPRVMKRQSLSREEAQRRVASQWNDQQYREAADLVLDGSQNEEHLKALCDKVMTERFIKEQSWKE